MMDLGWIILFINKVRKVFDSAGKMMCQTNKDTKNDARLKKIINSKEQFWLINSNGKWHYNISTCIQQFIISMKK